MSRPLHIDVSDLARAQIRAAEQWWRVNRPKAPNAIREELERASLLISVQPEIGARARNISLAGVRRLHLARRSLPRLLPGGYRPGAHRGPRVLARESR